MSPFGIRHSLTPQFFQGLPPLIKRLRMAAAFLLVPELAAERTDSFTVIAANGMHRQPQEDLLANHIREFDPRTTIKSNIQVGGVNFAFLAGYEFLFGAIEKIEIAVQGNASRFQAAVAFGFELAPDMAVDPDFSERSGDFSTTFNRQGDFLPQPGLQQIELARRQRQRKPNLPQFQFLQIEKQHTPPLRKRRAKPRV